MSIFIGYALFLAAFSVLALSFFFGLKTIKLI
nr:cytochrome b6-f complex subunit VI [Erythrolobus coxiae]UNJ17646.1 cytochrome b6-f complex subunit VI [Erythrolobus coxiae]